MYVLTYHNGRSSWFKTYFHHGKLVDL
jgi:hypothetical protein